MDTRETDTRRRELLKMLPLMSVAAIVHPGVRRALLDRGLALSDAASTASFRTTHLAATFDDRAVTPLHRFPLNSYLVDDPEIDLEAWRLQIGGLVQKPGDYTLDQLRRLPKIVQNTRHVCIEGWDVIGNFGGITTHTLYGCVTGRAGSR